METINSITEWNLVDRSDTKFYKSIQLSVCQCIFFTLE